MSCTSEHNSTRLGRSWTLKMEAICRPKVFHHYSCQNVVLCYATIMNQYKWITTRRSSRHQQRPYTALCHRHECAVGAGDERRLRTSRGQPVPRPESAEFCNFGKFCLFAPVKHECPVPYGLGNLQRRLHLQNHEPHVNPQFRLFRRFATRPSFKPPRDL
jgi:hypothetical protein